MLTNVVLPAFKGLGAAIVWLLDNLPLVITLVGAFVAAWAVVNFQQVAAAISNITQLLKVLISQIVAANIATGAWTAGLLAYAAAFYYVVQNGNLLSEELNREAKEIGTTVKAMLYMKDHAVDFATALELVTSDVDKLTYSYNKNGEKVRNFAGMTKDALKDFRESTKEAFAVSGNTIEGFKAKFEGTVRSFQRGLANMAHRAQETLRDLREFNQIDLGAGVKKFLLEQGPEAIDKFVDANKEGRDKAVGHIKTILDAEKGLGTEIDQAPARFKPHRRRGPSRPEEGNPTVTFEYKTSGGEALEQFLNISRSGS